MRELTAAEGRVELRTSDGTSEGTLLLEPGHSRHPTLVALEPLLIVR